MSDRRGRRSTPQVPPAPRAPSAAWPAWPARLATSAATEPRAQASQPPRVTTMPAPTPQPASQAGQRECPLAGDGGDGARRLDRGKPGPGLRPAVGSLRPPVYRRRPWRAYRPDGVVPLAHTDFVPSAAVGDGHLLRHGLASMLTSSLERTH